MVALRSLVSLVALITLALAEPQLSRSVLHEKRATSNLLGWTRLERHASDAALPLRFGLRQRNLDKLDEFLLAVSDPDSPDYGNHWSKAQVASTFAPNQDSVDTVKEWLVASGIHPDRVNYAAGKGWLELNATTAEAEQLLSTKYHIFEHVSGAKHIACDKYYLPEHVSTHIEIVTPSVHFDSKHSRRGSQRRSSAQHAMLKPGSKGVINATVPAGVGECDRYTTLDCLRALYGIDYKGPRSPPNKNTDIFAVVEYTPGAYLPSDLDMFYTNYSSGLVGTRPKLVSIDGGTDQTTEQSSSNNAESDLDIQYAQGLIGQMNLTLYQVGDVVEGASFGNFLDGLDSSYCTYEGGDDPNFDGIYPDTNGTAADGAYQGPESCGTVKNPAYVIASSYGEDEQLLTPFYATRQCHEYGKLGLMGISVLAASGDDGVAGYDGCLNDDSQVVDDGTYFAPNFPTSCPYVTAVGATQLPTGAPVTHPETANFERIFSGGGFSNYFPRPAYQQAQVSSYLKSYPPPYSSKTFNASSRAYPDISANGANFVTAIDGLWHTVYGTSASTPVVGAMIALITEARLLVGKKPLGFLNPALYSAGFQGAYNDITNGTNPGCGTVGFNATAGWDPVTGLGTPRFPVLMQKFMALP